MGNPNSVFFDYEGDRLDEGEELEIAPENPSGDDGDNGSNLVIDAINPVNAVINDTSEKVSGILDNDDNHDDDFLE